jgi:hypothetical protein
MESKQNESMRQTFQAIQTLATQTAAQEERLRRDLGSAMKDAQVPTVQVPAPVTQQAATPEYVEAARMEAAQVAREAAHAEFDARLQQFQAGVEAEKAPWASGLQETVNAFQQKMHIMEEARRRDHMTILKLQTVPGTSSRNVPATSSNPKAESYPQSATSIGSVPDLTTAPSKSSGATVGHASDRQKNPVEPKTGDLPATQSKTSKASSGIKQEPAIKTEASSKTVESSASKTTEKKPEVKPSAPKAEDKKSTKKETPKKHSSRDDGPSDSDPESSDNDSSDRDSDSSLDVPNSSAATTTVPNAAGVVTFRPYVNSSTLEDFNEYASLIARRRWYERFLNMAVQGGWTNESKVYELKIKMSPAVRNWRGQLRKSVRSDWKRLEKAFKREYCKSKVDDLER